MFSFSKKLQIMRVYIVYACLNYFLENQVLNGNILF